MYGYVIIIKSKFFELLFSSVNKNDVDVKSFPVYQNHSWNFCYRSLHSIQDKSILMSRRNEKHSQTMNYYNSSQHEWHKTVKHDY